MKLRDIIAAVGDRLDWIRIDYGWRVGDKGQVIPVLGVDLTLDTECEVLYFWYDHFDPRIDRRSLVDVIEKHDYETFLKWYVKFEHEPFTYFPKTATIFANGVLVGEVEVVLSKATFDLITENEVECG